MAVKKLKLKETRSDKAFDIINNIICALIFFVVAYPVWVVVISSISDPVALMSGKVWILPVGFNFNGYRAIFNHKLVWTGMMNSCIYAIAGTIVNMIVTVIAAYPLSRKDFSVRTPISLLFAFTMWFSGGLIPTYLLIKDLGLFDSRLVMIIPTAMSVWNMVIIKTYFESNISGELLESAKLDGCDDFKYLLKIAVPLSKPSLAVICLYYLVANWNIFMNAYLYLKDNSLYPIQIVLRQILLLGSVEDVASSAIETSEAQKLNELLKYSLVIVASLPMIIVYPFVQKYFVKGIMIGAVKG